MNSSSISTPRSAVWPRSIRRSPTIPISRRRFCRRRLMCRKPSGWSRATDSAARNGPPRVTLQSRVLRLLAFLLLAVLCTYAGGLAVAAQRSEIETLTAVAALPAHIAGSFQELSSCQQTAGGDYFIFDRRSHAVFVAPAGFESARKLITIGAEPGRLLDPSAFDLASDESFVVTDAPGGQPRVQVFLNTGSTVSVFRIPGGGLPRITFGNLVLGGL